MFLLADTTALLKKQMTSIEQSIFLGILEFVSFIVGKLRSLRMKQSKKKKNCDFLSAKKL